MGRLEKTEVGSDLFENAAGKISGVLQHPQTRNGNCADATSVLPLHGKGLRVECEEFLPCFLLLLSAFVNHRCPCFQWVTIKSVSVTAKAARYLVHSLERYLAVNHGNPHNNDADPTPASERSKSELRELLDGPPGPQG